MTTYFTPVGTLAELTRAKGSDINAREAAVTTAFTALEAALYTPTAGTITFHPAFSDAGSISRLYKSCGVVYLNLYATVIDDAVLTGPPPRIFTLPAGFRPQALMSYCTGQYISGGVPASNYFKIRTDGNVYAEDLVGANGDSVQLDIAFVAA